MGQAAFGEGEVGFEKPRGVLPGMRGFAGVVFGEAVAEVFGEACVNLCREGFAAEEVNVIHHDVFWEMRNDDRAYA